VLLLLLLLVLWPRQGELLLLLLLARMSLTRRAGHRACCGDATSVAMEQCTHQACAHLVLRGAEALPGIVLLLLLVPRPFLWLLLLLRLLPLLHLLLLVL
jgi:hypothetical protein